MKQACKSYLISGLLSIIVAVTFYACSKDAGATSPKVTGKWMQTTTGTLQQIEFKGDMTYQQLVFTTDVATDQTLGYRFKSVGTYKISGKALTLYNTTSYANPDNSYGTEAALIKTGSPVSEDYTFEITDNQLRLYFTCPPNANCVASPLVYSKQQ